jgi:hypothetical protein
MARSRTPQSTTLWLGIAFLLIGVSLAYLLVVFWPRTRVIEVRQRAVSAAPATPSGSGAREVEIRAEKKVWVEETQFLGTSFKLDADVRLLILVLLAGALGSYVHAVQSFASYVGNARFKATWTWWYILRLPMGAALAVFVYFGIRGGLLAAGTATASGAANELNLFGIMSFSGLAGLFSKQAADKLSEVFDTLFATKEDGKRKDKLGENPRPELASVAPDTLPAGGAAKEITLTGQGFVKDSVAKASGRKLPTTFVNAQSLTAKLATADFGNRKEIAIVIFSPEPAGGESDPVPLKINQEENGEMATVTPISGAPQASP